MNKIHKQLTICLLIAAIIGLQQIIVVGAIAPPPVEPPPGGVVTYRMYGYVKQTGTTLPLSSATVKFYGNGQTYLGSTSTNGDGYFNYYKSLTTSYSYVKAVVTKSGYQSASKIDYVSGSTYYFGNIYLTQLLYHHVMGFVDNDETSNPVAGVEVLIYGSTGGTGGTFTYLGSTTTDSNGVFTKTIYASVRYNAIFIDMSKDNYYDKTAITTGTTSFYFGTVEMHEYQKIGVFFWASNSPLAEDSEIESVITGYQDLLVSEGYTKFFIFHNTPNFESSMATVASYERSQDIVFLYSFSHGDGSGDLNLDGDDSNGYEVSASDFVTALLTFDNDKTCVLVSSCIGAQVMNEAVSTDTLFITASGNSKSWEWREPVDEQVAEYDIHYEQEAFAHYFFEGISLGKSANDAYQYAYDTLWWYWTNTTWYTTWQDPRIHLGTDGDVFFGVTEP